MKLVPSFALLLAAVLFSAIPGIGARSDAEMDNYIFKPIMANYNGSLEAVECHIHSVRYDIQNGHQQRNLGVSMTSSGHLRMFGFVLMKPSNTMRTADDTAARRRIKAATNHICN
eukprot:scaffold12886_cov80-Skeletonema_dohrnii-CCMP3373.AAC.3